MREGQESGPSVDIIIAVKNEEQMLGACLESLLDQDYDGATRIIVVDNRSTDATREICGRYPVELLIEEKTGPAAARNKGIHLGSGEFVAFLDGHCVANRSWVSAMVSRLGDNRVGGCQARIENRASDARVERYLNVSRVSDPDKILDDTIRGEHNIYPWMLSGNCMFTRAVLEHVGGFDETLPSCEDVDISWKAVLSGYLLDYAPTASVVHWNGDSWDAFESKSYTQGRGAAVLAQRYLRHGARNVFQPASPAQLDADREIIALEYQSGYEEEEKSIKAGEVRGVYVTVPEVRDFLRAPFVWTDNAALSISADVVYWLRDDSQSIVIHHPSQSRIVLDCTSDFLWRRLALGSSRHMLANDVTVEYRLAPDIAARDCDDFIRELVDYGVLIRHGR